MTDDFDNDWVAHRELRQQRERERAERWVAERWVGPKECPMCRSNNYNITHVVELRPYDAGNLTIGGGGVFPVFQIVCMICGYTRLINAVVADVYVADDDPGTDGEATS